MILPNRRKTALFSIGLLASSLTFAATSTHTLHANIAAYPGTKTTVTGNVDVHFNKKDLTLNYHLKGLKPVNNGGLHIHAGTSCQQADKVGGHYYAPQSAGDYWKSGQWTSDTKGNAQGSFHLISGLGYKANVGHAVVVHDANGDRIGCGILKK